MKKRQTLFVLLSVLLCLWFCKGVAQDLTEQNAPDHNDTLVQETDSAKDGDNQTSFDLTTFSIDELIDLQEAVRQELIAKGYNPYYEIERNDKGDAVARLQERLAELGYYNGKISGRFDSSTAQSLKQFEKANGLNNDGIASREDQIVLYSQAAIPKSVPTPRPIVSVEEEESIDSINTEEYGTLDYNAYYRNPENYRDLKVKLTGTVYQVMGNRKSGFHLLFSVGGNNVYLSVKDPGYNIMDKDRLIIYARMNGTHTYTSTMHQEITVPYATADAVVLR